MSGHSPPGDDSNDNAEDSFPGDLAYYLSLSTDRLEQEIRAGGKDITKFVEEHGLALSDFAEWIRRQKKAGHSTPIEITSSSSPEEGMDEKEIARRARELQKLHEYAAATKNEAINARKAFDDAEVAFRTGATLPQFSVLEVQKATPARRSHTPTVVATGSARVVVSTKHANKGLRAAGGYYDHVAEEIRQLARDFVVQHAETVTPLRRGQTGGGNPSGSPTGTPGTTSASAMLNKEDPAGDDFTSPQKEGSEESRRTPPQSRHRVSRRPGKLSSHTAVLSVISLPGMK